MADLNIFAILRQPYLFFLATYAAQGLIGIAYEPVAYLQKDVLGLSPSRSAAFTAVMTAPFLLKPLLGLLSDACPWRGRRRRPYVLAASGATAAAWVALALLPRYSYASCLALLTAASLGIAFSDVLCDALMVELGKRARRTGLFQSVQVGALYLSLLAAGAGGGWLAAHASYRAVFGLTALFPLLIFVSAWGLEEAPSPEASPRRALEGLKTLLRGPGFWALCAAIFLYHFNPLLGTALFYHQSGALGFSKLFIGTLTSLSGLAGLLGAALFARAALRLKGPALTRLSLAAGAPLALLYLGYGAGSAAGLTMLFGAAGVFARLSFMDLAARSCPENGEAASFAVFMAVFNVAALASNSLGGRLYGAWAPRLGPESAADALALVACACAAAAWLLRRRLPDPA